MDCSWLINNMGLNCMGPLICVFFFFLINTQSASVFLSFVSVDSTNSSWKTIFSVCSWESVGVEGWLHALFYAILHRDLSIHSFWYPQCPGNNLPADTKGWLSVGGVKSYTTWIFNCVGFWKPHVVQGSTVLRDFILSLIYTNISSDNSNHYRMLTYTTHIKVRFWFNCHDKLTEDSLIDYLYAHDKMFV